MPRKTKHIKDETFAAVIRDYLASDKFKALAEGSQAGYLRHLKMIQASDHLGEISIYVLRPAVVQAYIDGFAAFPGKQKTVLSVLLAVQKWSAPRDRLPHPITTGVECIDRDGGHQPWTDAQISLAEAHARPDLARVVTLMRHTGQRGSDVVRMGWADLEIDGATMGINIIQDKTGRKLWIPLEPELREAIDSWERRFPPLFVLNPFSGAPYTRPLLSWHWNKQRDANPLLAPLAGLALHGLRASRVVILRKRGMSELEIEDTVGMSAPMVKRYCRLADQRSRAKAAFIRFQAPGTLAEQNESRKPKK